jgi:hypothetical protein
VKITTVPIFEIVRLIDLQPTGQTEFSILVASPDDTDLVPELRQELDVQAGVTLALIDAKDMPPTTLLEQLRLAQEPIILISGLEQWNDEQFISLDINRSRLETGAFLIFKMDLNTVARFLDRAPNLRSFIGTSIFISAPDSSTMSAQEISERLHQLREHYRMSDEEVVERAENGSLPAEPHFAEWLFLLGRSELVG